MVAFLFPGQGSQQAGAAALFRDTCAEARDIFDKAAAILPEPVLEIILSGSQEALTLTCNAQPGLLCVEAAVVALLGSLGVRPSVCAGHSLGEIPALVACGSLLLEDALRLVMERARLMSEDVPPGGMAAVMGLSPEAIEQALPDTVQIANYNGPAQTIISGTEAGLKEAAASLKEAGAKRVLPLAVSGPFHSRFMEPAARALAAYLRQTPIAPPACSFISSVSGAFETDPERMRALLAEQLYLPVRWTAVMEALSGAVAIEAGPGTVLQGLAKRMPGGPLVHSAATPEACRELVGNLE